MNEEYAKQAIPKDIIEMHSIYFYGGHLSINSPVYINIQFDDMFKIEENTNEVSIRNSLINVTLWKDMKYMHITVYPKM